jgi:uncharacterized protein (DUF302 family)
MAKTVFDYDIDIKIPVQLRIWNEEADDVESRIENKMDLILGSEVIKDDTLQMIFRDIDDYINANIMRNR